MVAFRPVSWQPNEPATRDKLEQMTENDQFLFENTSNMVYRDRSGIRTTTSLKLIAGVAVISSGKGESGAVNVSYAGEFNTGVTPIITTGLVVTNSNEHSSSISVRGRGSTLPNDSGFQFRWEVRNRYKENQKRKGSAYCNYMALGVSTRVTAAPE